MKYLIAILICICTFNLKAQTHVNLKKIKPDTSFQNIHIQKLSSDSLQSTFIIWVKKNVKNHFHAFHSENIYIIEGKAEMTLGDKTIKIKPGDYLNFPKGVKHSIIKVTSSKPLKVISVQSPQFIGKDRVFVNEN